MRLHEMVGGHGGRNAHKSMGARESEVSQRVVERRYVLLAHRWRRPGMELESNWSGTRNWIAKGMDGQCLSGARAGGMQRERAAGSLAKVAGITSIHLAHRTYANPKPCTTTFDPET